ncbi:MAG: S41 family peptidase [Candidatus Acidiferrales bacterium]|jgi:carboxyl-terminal processing protease
MNRLLKIGILSLSFLVLGYVGLGHVLGKTSDEKAYRSLIVYGEVLQKIQQDYVDEPNVPMVTAGALHGLLESLDPQSSYLTPREYTEYRQKIQSGKPGDTGMTLSKRYGYIVVVSVLPDSSAEKANIRSGDILEAIAGFTTRDMSVGQAMNLLLGDPGTSVKVSVVRRSRIEPQDVDLVRAQLVPQKIIAEKIDADILALRLPSLEAGRAQEVRERLSQAEHQGIHKIVLDVRDCGRGDISEGVAIARMFLASGTIATVRGQTVASQTISADPSKVVWKGPVSMLISPTTSGAAEILAAAIAANKRGDVVGERTFGLASEQKLIPLDDGGAIILTVANYFANGNEKSILEEGVAPTVVVREAAENDSDAVDDSAAPLPQTEETPSAPRPLSADDPVLRKAIELLKAPAPKAS